MEPSQFVRPVEVLLSSLKPSNLKRHWRIRIKWVVLRLTSLLTLVYQGRLWWLYCCCDHFQVRLFLFGFWTVQYCPLWSPHSILHSREWQCQFWEHHENFIAAFLWSGDLTLVLSSSQCDSRWNVWSWSWSYHPPCYLSSGNPGSQTSHPCIIH